MNPKEYIKLTGVTDHDFAGTMAMSERMRQHATLLHYVLGVGTEAGELQDAVKRMVAYGKPCDIINIKEEVGDCLWYLARICNFMNCSLEHCMELNINKLKARYGDKFTEHAALNRDLIKEREILEE